MRAVDQPRTSSTRPEVDRAEPVGEGPESLGQQHLAGVRRQLPRPVVPVVPVVSFVHGRQRATGHARVTLAGRPNSNWYGGNDPISSS